MLRSRMTTLAFLLLKISPLPLFEFDCNANTLWIILILLGRNVEQDEMTCCL